MLPDWTATPGGTPRRSLAATAALIAAVATVGSLYFSYGMGLFPCDLCWFQRVFMYPLVIVFAIGAIRDRPVFDVGVALAVPGLLVAAYHSAIQRIGDGPCPTGACGVVQYEVLGLTIPNLALLAFAAILALAAAAHRAQ